MKRCLILALLLSGCGDNLKPPVPTQRDAWTRWAESLCSYSERCFPEDYQPSEHEDCVAAEVFKRCHSGVRDCDEEWPEGREGAMRACEMGMEELVCGSPFAPAACTEALL